VLLKRRATPGTTESPAFVVSAFVGDVGGVALATLLLAEELAAMGQRPHVFVSQRPPKSVLDRLKASGVRVTVPWVNKGWRWQIPLRMLVMQLYLQAHSERPSFIQVLSLGIEARLVLRLPAIGPVYVWETTEALPNIKFVDTRIRRVLRRAAAVLAPSQAIARNVRNTYRYDGPVHILPFWIDAPQHEEPNFDRSRTANMLYVGRLDQDKGFEYLFEAFRLVQVDYPEVTLTVRGLGPVEPLRRLAADTRNIDVGGYITPDDYEGAIDRADVAVLPSLHEGYPLSLLEACARSKPVIATSVGSIPEVFGNRPCALLVPPRDAAELATAIRTLLSEEDQRYRERCRDSRQLFEKVSSGPVVRCHLAGIYAASEA
jgi:glycosyltransferase involved in cell wall biosynthesis